MIVGSQPKSNKAFRKAGTVFAAHSVANRAGYRQLDQIVVRFHPEVIFHVAICYEFETPSHKTPPPDVMEAGKHQAVV